MNKLPLHWKIVIGLVAGIVVGVVLNWAAEPIARAVEGSDALARLVHFVVQLNDFIGKLFIRCLRFIAVPIVLFSLIVGVAQLGDVRKLGRIGGKTIGIYMATTCVAVCVGLLVANVLRPGSVVSQATRDQLMAERQAEIDAKVEAGRSIPSLWDQALNLVPQNPFEAIAKGDMLQVIVFALAIGVGLSLIPRAKAAPVVAMFDALTGVITGLVGVILWLAPIAVFALIVPVVATMGLDILRALAVYTLVVVAGLAVLLFVEYPLLLRVFAGVGYARFFRAMAPAQLLAFSSSSSNATLPVTMECVHRRLGVSEEVTSFVCPLGATINMDGTALYQGVAAVFIAQMFAMDLTLADQLTIVLTATLASIGTPGVPGVGIVMLVIVLESVHIPAQGIAVILGVDRLLDMCRTVVNVTGDAMTAAIIAKSEGEQLAEPTR